MSKTIYINLDLNKNKPHKTDPIFEYDNVELIVTLQGQTLDLYNETLNAYYSIYGSDEPSETIYQSSFKVLDNNKFCLFLDNEVTKNIGVLMLQVAIIDSQHFCTPNIMIPIRNSLAH